MKKADYASADILTNVHCKDCGWPVIECVNGLWMGTWDWWDYCSNKDCINHEGEGVFQDIVKWIERD